MIRIRRWLCRASLVYPLLLAGATSRPAAAQTDWDKINVTSAPVADGVYVLHGTGGNIGVSAGDDGIILVDDQFAQLSDKIKAALFEISEKPVRFIINTHWHGDHTGGNETFANGGAWIVAQDNVRRRLSTEQVQKLLNRTTPPSLEAAWPVITFSQNIDFHLNGQNIHVFHVENAHTDGDAIVHFQNRNVLHMGDCFWNGIYPLIDVASGGTLHGMIRAADEALRLADGSTKIIPGHGPVGNREDLRAFRDMLVAAEQRLTKLVSEGKTLQQIVDAKPLADYDAKWGGGYMNPGRFLETLYADLHR